MSLNKEFFDNIQIELVKRKYYNSNKVDAVISDIRTKALALVEENSRLSAELSTLTSQKAEIAEAVMNAQLLHSDILQKASRAAEDKAAEAETRAQLIISEAQKAACEIVADAQAQAQKMLEDAQAQADRVAALEAELAALKQGRQDYAVSKVENCFAMLRQRHMDAVDALNHQWQEFLCGLFEDEAAVAQGDLPVADEGEVISVELATPADLGEKVGAIAKELDELENVAQ